MTLPPLQFLFDVVSPYSWLAAESIRDFAARVDLALEWRPVLIGGLFQSTGNVMPASNPAKAVYLVREVGELAELHGLEARFPARFPTSTLQAQRVLTALALEGDDGLPEAALALFRAYWQRGIDVGTPEGILQALEGTRDDVPALLGRTADPAVKERLRASTDAAATLGIFGLPVFQLGEQWWWGHDRVSLVEAAAARLRAAER